MVQISFSVGGVTRFTTKLSYTAEEILSGVVENETEKKRKFKIPISVN